jgi:hypothetical protein
MGLEMTSLLRQTIDLRATKIRRSVPLLIGSFALVAVFSALSIRLDFPILLPTLVVLSRLLLVDPRAASVSHMRYDPLVMMEAGEIVETSSFDALLASSPAFARMVRLSAGAGSDSAQ